MRTFLLLFGLIIPIIPVFATGDIYKYVNPDGIVEYSDQPSAHAIKIEVIPLSVKTETSRQESSESLSAPSYQATIIKPQDGATIRDNTGKVAVGLRIDPPLEADSGYTFQLLLDGQNVGGSNSSTQYTLTNVAQGTHTLQAKLLAPSGSAVAQVGAVTFHIKHASTPSHPANSGED